MSRDWGVGRGICIAAIVELEPETLEKGQRRSGVATHARGPRHEGRERPVGGQRRHEGGLHCGQVVDPEERDRHAGDGRRRSPAGGLGGQCVEPRIVDESAAAQRGDVVPVERREIDRLARPDDRERVGGYAGFAQVVDGARQRARQTWGASHRLEVPARLAGTARDERRDQTLAQQRREQARAIGICARARLRKAVGGKFGGERVDRDEPHPGVRAEMPGDGPRQVPAGEVGAGHHDDLAQRIATLDRGDPAGERRFEARAAAEDEASV